VLTMKKMPMAAPSRRKKYSPMPSFRSRLSNSTNSVTIISEPTVNSLKKVPKRSIVTMPKTLSGKAPPTSPRRLHCPSKTQPITARPAIVA